MRSILVACALFAVACQTPAGPPPDASLDHPDPAPDTLGPDQTPPPPPPPPSELVCEKGKTCPACVDGQSACAPRGPFIGKTCCTLGDSVQPIGQAQGNEVVDVESDGTYLISCGGFGADISKLSPSGSPVFIDTKTARCQRIAFGPKIGSAQIVYIAHHGDSWVAIPQLTTLSIQADGLVTQVNLIEDKDVLFEGMVFHDGVLYVAAHDGGVRVYNVDAKGAPVFARRVVGPIKNAWKLAADSDTLYVADAEAGLVLFDINDKTTPKAGKVVVTNGTPRDVTVEGSRAYVAMGASGVDVFDITNAAAPKRITTLATRGSAQAVTIVGEVLAIASWNHIALHDTTTWALLGLERTRIEFEQDLGIATIDKTRFVVGEWEGMHLFRYFEGFVGPTMWIEDDSLSLNPQQPSRAVIVENVGVLPLKVTSIKINDKAYTVFPTTLDVPPGDKGSFEVSRPAPAPSTQSQIDIETNDPDPRRARDKLNVTVRDGVQLDIGDSIGADFGFLDATQDINNLRGKVIVLAYFALF